MNVAAFIDYLNKTKNLQLDPSYYSSIEIVAAVVAGQRARRAQYPHPDAEDGRPHPPPGIPADAKARL